MTGWNELQKLIFAKKSLTGLAKLFVQSVRRIKTWSDLKEKLTSEFELIVSSAQVHKMLMNRKKAAVESVQEYALIMRELGSIANIEHEVVIQHIIDGIPDDSSNKIVLYGARNFTEFKEKIKLYNQIKSRNPGPTRERMKFREDKGKDVSKEVCFNCGKKGHKSNVCSSKGPKCFKCQSYGHIAPKCRKDKEIKSEMRQADDKNIHNTMDLVTIFLLYC